MPSSFMVMKYLLWEEPIYQLLIKTEITILLLCSSVIFSCKYNTLHATNCQVFPMLCHVRRRALKLKHQSFYHPSQLLASAYIHCDNNQACLILLQHCQLASHYCCGGAPYYRRHPSMKQASVTQKRTINLFHC